MGRVGPSGVRETWVVAGSRVQHKVTGVLRGEAHMGRGTAPRIWRFRCVDRQDGSQC